jgi:anti-sigma regulatory factor (Ser/Thr protein kinase)
MRVYTLEVERDMRLITAARVFAAAVARRALCTEETVLDVKIAVSEALTAALEESPHSRRPPVHIRVEDQGTHLLFEIEDRGFGLSPPLPDAEGAFAEVAKGGDDDQQELRKAFIQALFPGARFHSAARGTLLSFEVSP